MQAGTGHAPAPTTVASMSLTLPVTEVARGELTVVERNTMYVMKTPRRDASVSATQKACRQAAAAAAGAGKQAVHKPRGHRPSSADITPDPASHPAATAVQAARQFAAQTHRVKRVREVGHVHPLATQRRANEADGKGH
jgi:hypothetical protein